MMDREVSIMCRPLFSTIGAGKTSATPEASSVLAREKLGRLGLVFRRAETKSGWLTHTRRIRNHLFKSDATGKR
jgi:hypothetical protein